MKTQSCVLFAADAAGGRVSDDGACRDGVIVDDNDVDRAWAGVHSRAGTMGSEGEPHRPFMYFEARKFCSAVDFSCQSRDCRGHQAPASRQVFVTGRREMKGGGRGRGDWRIECGRVLGVAHR